MKSGNMLAVLCAAIRLQCRLQLYLMPLSGSHLQTVRARSAISVTCCAAAFPAWGCRWRAWLYLPVTNRSVF